MELVRCHVSTEYAQYSMTSLSATKILGHQTIELCFVGWNESVYVLHKREILCARIARTHVEMLDSKMEDSEFTGSTI